jgi:hypothetical protein
MLNSLTLKPEMLRVNLEYATQVQGLLHPHDQSKRQTLASVRSASDQHVGTTTIYKESSTTIIELYEGTKQSKIVVSATVDWPTVDPITESG